MKKVFDIVGRWHLWVLFALWWMSVALFLFFTNLRLSIEFTGGIQAQLAQINNVDSLKTDLQDFLQQKGLKDVEVGIAKEKNYYNLLIKVQIPQDKDAMQISDSIKWFLLSKWYVKDSNDILSFALVGPSIGDYMKKSAVKAIIWALVLIVVYMLFAFASIREYISPLLLALVTLFTLLFDVSSAAWFYGLWEMINPTIQVNSIFIIGVLIIMGYSINDTIIIFDRIRENLILDSSKLKKGKITEREIFNKSLWQTMRRSIGTSLSTLLALLALFVFGTELLRIFAVVVGVGVIAGTYSSIFVAAPLAYFLSWRK